MITIDELKMLCKEHTYCMDCPIYKECKESNTAHSVREFLDNIEEKADRWINKHSIKDKTKIKKEVVTKNEFNNWVQDTYQKFIKDKEAIVAYEGDEKIIVLDTETDEIFAYNFIESEEGFAIDPMINTAIAYAKLRKIEIPKAEEEPAFERVKFEEKYYALTIEADKGASTKEYIEEHMGFDELTFKSNNYFHTKERAEKVADKINFLLKLERLHDIYCPNYKPDWNSAWEQKFYVLFDAKNRKYIRTNALSVNIGTSVYFDSAETVQKVCDVLNKELKMTF